MEEISRGEESLASNALLLLSSTSLCPRSGDGEEDDEVEDVRFFSTTGLVFGDGDLDSRFSDPFDEDEDSEGVLCLLGDG